jgi:hypothetical protein
MTFTIKKYEPQDHALLAEWWTAWGWPVIIPSWLPDFGLIVSLDDVPIFAGFLIETNTCNAIIEWVISNPAKKEGREQAKEILLSLLSDYAGKRGYYNVFLMTPSKHLINTAEKQGFCGTSDLKHCVKKVK